MIKKLFRPKTLLKVAITVAAFMINPKLGVAVGMGFLGRMLAPKTPKVSGSGFKDTIRSPIAPRTVVYGQRAVSGPIIYIGTHGPENRYLDMIVAVTGHPVHDITHVVLNDEQYVISGNWNGNNNTEYKIRNANSDFDNLVTVVKVTGWGQASGIYNPEGSATIQQQIDDNTREAFIRNAIPGNRWTENHKLTNCSYVYLRFEYNPEKLATIPSFYFIVQGKRVYDPREVSHDINNAKTWEFSENTALQILDYIKDESYGLKISTGDDPYEEIVMDSFIEAANDCDDLVPSGLAGDPVLTTRYMTSAIMYTNVIPIQNLETLLFDVAGFLSYRQGAYSLRVGKYKDPGSPDESNTITESDIIGELQIRTSTPRAETFNKVSGTFVLPGVGSSPIPYSQTPEGEAQLIAANRWRADRGLPPMTAQDLDLNFGLGDSTLFNYEATDFPIVNPVVEGTNINPYEEEDGEELIKEFEFVNTTNYLQAQRVARLYLERNRQGIIATAKLNFRAFRLSVGDTIYVDVPIVGWDETIQAGSFKQFLILNATVNNDYTVDLVLQEEAPEIYEWQDGFATEEDYAPNTALAAMRGNAPPAPPLIESITTSISVQQDGTAVPIVTINWSLEDLYTTPISAYEVEYGVVTGSGAATPAGTVANWLTAARRPHVPENQLQGPVILRDLENSIPSPDPSNSGILRYNFRIRSIDVRNRRSGWVYYSTLPEAHPLGFLIASENPEPNQIAGLTTVSGLPGVINLVLDLSNNNERDIEYVEVIDSPNQSNPNEPGAVTSAFPVPNRLDLYSDYILDYSVTDTADHYFWVRLVNSSGVPATSHFPLLSSDGVQGNAVGVQGADIFYILPLDGTAILDGQGELRLQARSIINGVDSVLTAGGTRMYFQGTSDLVGNGYTATLTSSDFTNSVVIELRDGSEGNIYDTIALVDITDGVPGSNAVYGFINPINGLAYVQDRNDGLWNTTAPKQFNIGFVQGGEFTARQGVQVTLNPATGILSASLNTHDEGNLNTGRLSITIIGSGVSNTLTISATYEHEGFIATVAETVVAIRGGTRGTDGDPGLSIAEVVIYRRAENPFGSAPTGGSFNFGTQTLTPPVGWSIEIPEPIGDPVYPVYASISLVASEDPSAIVVPTWTVPVRVFADGTDGDDGLSVDIIFRRSEVQPDTPAPSSSTPTGWSTNNASAPGTGPLWSSIGKRPGGLENFSWQTPIRIEGQDGTSVRILGSLANSSLLPTPGDEIGDAYLIEGDLWVWDGTDWNNAGNIEGPPGPPGVSPYTGLLTNEAHIVTANFEGDQYSLSSAGGTFRVWQGTTEITGTVSYSIVGSSSSNGLSISINSSGVYSLSGGSWTSDFATFTLRAAINGVTIDRTYTIVKSRAGEEGDPGVAIRLNSTANGFKYDGEGDLLFPSSIVFEVDRQNSNSSVTWLTQRWNGSSWENTTQRLTGTSDTGATLTEANFVASGEDALRIVAEITNGITLRDSITIVRIQDGVSAVYGEITSNNGFVWVREPNEGDWNPSAAQTLVTIRFFRGNQVNPIAEIENIPVSLNTSTGTISSLADTQHGIEVTVINNDSPAVTLVFRHIESNVRISQTFEAIQGGLDGAPGFNTATVTAYKRSASAPIDNPGTIIYTFNNPTGWSPDNDWSIEIPEGDNPLYVVSAVAFANTPTYQINAGQWSSPVQIVKDGETGLNSASVFIYRRTTSNTAPAGPTSVSTYTFATGVTTGLNNSWETEIPVSGGDYIWVRTAAAVSTEATDTISSGEWSVSKLLSQRGEEGAPAIYGIITNNNGLSWVRAPNAGSWNRTNNTTLTATFFEGGSGVASLSRAVSFSNGTLTATGTTSGGVSVSVTGSGSSTVTLTFTYGGISVSETLYAVQGGFQGDEGLPGISAPRRLTGFVYFQNPQSSAPSTPSATNYNFGTSSFVGLTSNWSIEPPTMQPGENNRYWYSYFNTEEGISNNIPTGTGSATFSTPVQGMGFSGLVTFVGDEILDDDGNVLIGPDGGVTRIFGGQIETSSLSAISATTGELRTRENYVSGPALAPRAVLSSLSQTTPFRIQDGFDSDLLFVQVQDGVATVRLSNAAFANNTIRRGSVLSPEAIQDLADAMGIVVVDSTVEGTGGTVYAPGSPITVFGTGTTINANAPISALRLREGDDILVDVSGSTFASTIGAYQSTNPYPATSITVRVERSPTGSGSWSQFASYSISPIRESFDDFENQLTTHTYSVTLDNEIVHSVPGTWTDGNGDPIDNYFRLVIEKPSNAPNLSVSNFSVFQEPGSAAVPPHEHSIENVNGLQTALDSKAELASNQTFTGTNRFTSSSFGDALEVERAGSNAAVVRYRGGSSVYGSAGFISTGAFRIYEGSSTTVRWSITSSGVLETGTIPWARLTDIPDLGTATRLRSNTNSFLSGDITLSSGTGISLSQSGNTITVLATGDATPNEVDWGVIQNTPTNLSGYGITDAVTIATGQTITGHKHFNASPSSGTPALNVTRVNHTGEESAVIRATMATSANDRFLLSLRNSGGSVFSVRGNGDVYFSGTMQQGTVPWARLSGVPTTLPGVVQTINGVQESDTPSSLRNTGGAGNTTFGIVDRSTNTGIWPYRYNTTLTILGDPGNTDPYGFQLLSRRIGSGELYYRAASSGTDWRSWGQIFTSEHPPAWGDVTSKPSTFPPESHTHTWGDIVGINAGQIESANPTFSRLYRAGSSSLDGATVHIALNASDESYQMNAYDRENTKFRVRHHSFNGSWQPWVDLARDDEVVKLTGDQTIAGTKTFTDQVRAWDGGVYPIVMRGTSSQCLLEMVNNNGSRLAYVGANVGRLDFLVNNTTGAFRFRNSNSTAFEFNNSGTMTAGTVPWARIAGQPTTIAGYGITNGPQEFGVGTGSRNLSSFTSTDANVGRVFRALSSATGGPGVAISGVAAPYDGTPSTGYLAVSTATSPRLFAGRKNGASATPSWVEFASLSTTQTITGHKHFDVSPDEGTPGLNVTRVNHAGEESAVIRASMGTSANSRFLLSLRGGSSSVFSVRGNGDVYFSGTLGEGTVPWARLSDIPASATRGEISTTNIANTGSSTQGFITGRRFNHALTTLLPTVSSAEAFNLTSTARRAWTPARIREAIESIATTSGTGGAIIIYIQSSTPPAPSTGNGLWIW